MTDLVVWIPREITISPENVVDESRIPLLPASKIGRGTLHPDRIPQINANLIAHGTIDIERLPASILDLLVFYEGLSDFIRVLLQSEDIDTARILLEIDPLPEE